jgi:hypothetical protein
MHAKALLGLTAVLTPLFIFGFNRANGHLEGRVIFSPELQADHHLEAQENLDMTYGVLTQLLNPIACRKLDISQKAWSQFKVAECDFKANYSAENPIHPMSYNECLITMNTERALDLQAEIHWHLLFKPRRSALSPRLE